MRTTLPLNFSDDTNKSHANHLTLQAYTNVHLSKVGLMFSNHAAQIKTVSQKKELFFFSLSNSPCLGSQQFGEKTSISLSLCIYHTKHDKILIHI